LISPPTGIALDEISRIQDMKWTNSDDMKNVGSRPTSLIGPLELKDGVLILQVFESDWDGSTIEFCGLAALPDFRDGECSTHSTQDGNTTFVFSDLAHEYYEIDVRNDDGRRPYFRVGHVKSSKSVRLALLGGPGDNNALLFWRPYNVNYSVKSAPVGAPKLLDGWAMAWIPPAWKGDDPPTRIDTAAHLLWYPVIGLLASALTLLATSRLLSNWAKRESDVSSG